MAVTHHEPVPAQRGTAQLAPPRVTVVMPVGPGTEPTFVADTLDAARHYAASPPRIVLVDDSGAAAATRAARHHDVEIVTTPSDNQARGRYLALSKGFARALEQPFDILLRLDTDATVIGRDWDLVAWEQMGAEPDLAILGNHMLGYDATPRDLRPSQPLFDRAVSRRSMVSAPGQRSLLRALLTRAHDHGYQRAEHVLGGACVYSHRALAALSEAELLARPELARAPLREDQVFGLLVASLGLRMRQFGTRFDALPCAVQPRGLPDTPEALIAAGKALVHSTRYAGGRHEGEIRAVFAAHRRTEARIAGHPAPSRSAPAPVAATARVPGTTRVPDSPDLTTRPDETSLTSAAASGA